MVRRWRHRRLLLALALAASASLTTALVPRPPLVHALTHTNTGPYSCGDLVQGHCYGVDEWDRPVSGSEVYITPQTLTAGDGFVTNEMWLFGAPPSNLICPNGQDPHGGGTCWVETGVIAGPVDDTYCEAACYFWADERPSAPGTVDNFNSHFLGYTPYQDFNHGVQFKLFQATDGSGRYDIQVFDKSCLFVPDYSDVSTQDQMIPYGVQIGLEMAGSSGAAAPHAEYTGNGFQDNNGWHYEIDGGTDISDGASPGHHSPISRGWDQVPTPDGYLPISGPGQTYTGGDWYTKFP